MAAADIGIVLQGGLYNTVLRALERLGLADVFGESKIPLYVLNVTYPLVPDEFTRFAQGKKAILIIEEGQPEFIEQAASLFLRQADVQTRIVGKGPLPMAGEYTGAVVIAGLRKFLAEFGQLPAADIPLLPAAMLARKADQVLMAENGAGAQHDDGFAGPKKRLGDRGKQF